jgi:hypothetical protein
MSNSNPGACDAPALNAGLAMASSHSHQVSKEP